MIGKYGRWNASPIQDIQRKPYNSIPISLWKVRYRADKSCLAASHLFAGFKACALARDGAVIFGSKFAKRLQSAQCSGIIHCAHEDPARGVDPNMSPESIKCVLKMTLGVQVKY